MQHILVLVIALLTAGLVYTVIAWPGTAAMTFSQHAATNRWSKIYYALLFLITLPLLMWFFFMWLAPQRNLPLTFLWFAGVAVAFQIVCTWFPEEGGVKTMIHRLLTGISAIAMLPLMLIIATTPTVTLAARILAWIGSGVMLTLLGIAVRHRKGFRWALAVQIGYYAAFFVVLLATTYTGGRSYDGSVCLNSGYRQIISGMDKTTVTALMREPESKRVKSSADQNFFYQGDNEARITEGWIYPTTGDADSAEIYFNNAGRVIGKGCGQG